MRVSTYNTYIHTYIHTCLSLRDNSFSRNFDAVKFYNRFNNEVKVV